MTTQFSNDRQNDRELTLDELEIVSGGDKAKASSGTGKPATYLQYDLTNCFVSGYSLSGSGL